MGINAVSIQLRGFLEKVCFSNGRDLSLELFLMDLRDSGKQLVTLLQVNVEIRQVRRPVLFGVEVANFSYACRA
jgi:hypothetical protein